MTQRILLTGLGAHGFNTYIQEVLPPLIAAGRIELVGLVDPKAEARRRAASAIGLAQGAAFHDLASALAATQADALIVCSPYLAHEADVKLAAASGLHLFIEKPVCGDPASVLRCINFTDTYKVKAAVNMSARFETEKLAFGEAVRSGAAGKVEYLFARSSWNHEANARFRAKTPHPYLMEAGVHALDLLRICAGGRPKRVFNLAWPSPQSVFKGNASNVVSFEMDNGVRCVLEGSWATRTGLATWREEYIRADGEAGSLLLDQRRLKTLQGTAEDPNARIEREIPYQPEGPSGTTYLFHAFLDWLDGTRDDHPTEIHQNLDCMALLFAAIESAETGQAVDVIEFLENAS